MSTKESEIDENCAMRPSELFIEAGKSVDTSLFL